MHQVTYFIKHNNKAIKLFKYYKKNNYTNYTK